MRIVDRFHKVLAEKLRADIETRTQNLVKFGATKLPEDTKTTAEKYAAQCSYISALVQVLEICDEISNDQYGNQLGGDE